MERCAECQGRRVIARQIAEVKRSQGMDYTTGRMVDRLYQCPACGGTGQAPEPDPPAGDGREVIEVGAFEIAGATVQAPGFEREGFLAFVERARASQLRTTPASTPGAVMVQSGSSPASYAVTRAACECQGHLRHGRCYHRAYVIWLADVAGVDVLKVPTIGVSKRGLPLTFGRKPAVKGAA